MIWKLTGEHPKVGDWMKGEWIKAESDAIRAQTIEECARIADKENVPVSRHIAKAIRALAKPAETKEASHA